MSSDTRLLVKRFAKAYLSLMAMMCFVLAVAISKGSDWKALLVGAPLFVTLFIGISYQLLKEVRELKQKRSESALPDRSKNGE